MKKSSKRKCEQCKKVRPIREGRKICYSCRTLQANISSGKMRPPDYPDTTTAGYKEPMEAVKNGFSYYGAITRTTDGKMIQCHICGYFVSKLGAHIIKHDIKPLDYKIKFGLRLKEGLLSPVAKLKAQETYNKNARAAQHLKTITQLAKKRREEKPWKTGGGDWSAQKRNERGLCKEQTLAKIRQLAALRGGVARHEDYAEEYGCTDAVRHWFGSWSKGVKAAGLENYTDRVGANKAIAQERTLQNMVAFYEQQGRTPQNADFTSDNGLAVAKTVRGWFGTLNNARQIAGVPQLVWYKGKWVEQM